MVTEHLRRNGLFALVAVALCACGSVAAQDLGTTAQPSASPTSTPTPSSSTSASSSPITSDVPAPTCPTAGPNVAPPTTFCETAAEQSLGETVVHSPTLPDSVLLNFGISLTVAPSDTAAISQQNAISTAASSNGFNSSPHSAVFGEVHDQFGNPATGQLVWIVDVTPENSSDVQYAIVVVNPTTGKVIEVASQAVPGSDQAGNGM